ncbi:MAG: hypothetical protein OXC65_08675 [Thiotrichales bacterium]|nr:hypothetical protein [Thiotrichales bacterium]
MFRVLFIHNGRVFLRPRQQLRTFWMVRGLIERHPLVWPATGLTAMV